MFARVRCRFVPAMTLGLLLIAPIALFAQHHGGHGAGGVAGGGMSRPDGVNEKDTLKDFHEALAVQATSVQVAEFQQLLKETDAVKSAVETYLHDDTKHGASPAGGSADPRLDSALQALDTDHRTFVSGFSAKQKSGLKNSIRRLEKADASLDEEHQRFSQSLQLKSRPENEISSRAGSLDKSLTEFSNQQLALGREMGITLASADDQTFNLPSVKSPVRIANLSLAVPVSGELSQTGAQGGQRIFKIELLGNLSDLQQNVNEVLHAELDRTNSCGENLSLRRAALTASGGAGLVILNLHFERWTCMRLGGQTVPNELAENDGTVEVKLLPSLAPSNGLKLDAEFGRIEASGLMGEAIRSGSLGDDIRKKVAESVVAALRAVLDFPLVLPPVIRSSVVLETTRFQPGPGELDIHFEGQLQLSDEQASALASQLNQSLSAQTSGSR